jgi:hypothetical protein
VRGVALDRLDQVRDQVVAPLELDVDLRPRRLHLVALADQLVVGRDRPDSQDDEAEAEQAAADPQEKIATTYGHGSIMLGRRNPGPDLSRN